MKIVRRIKCKAARALQEVTRFLVVTGLISFSYISVGISQSPNHSLEELYETYVVPADDAEGLSHASDAEEMRQHHTAVLRAISAWIESSAPVGIPAPPVPAPADPMDEYDEDPMDEYDDPEEVDVSIEDPEDPMDEYDDPEDPMDEYDDPEEVDVSIEDPEDPMDEYDIEEDPMDEYDDETLEDLESIWLEEIAEFCNSLATEGAE